MQSADLNAGLLAGAKLGRRELVSLCLDEGADMDAADDKGMTALHLAALYGHHDLVEFLLGRGAAETYKEETDPERLAEQGGAGGPTIINSPLHWAVLRGHLRCVWLLLGAGYSPLDLDQCGNNALHLAAACTCASRATQLVLLRSLMHAGFDPDARNWYGQRAVDLLPTDALEARRLLTAAAETTRCPTTGAPFGANELRYLCASSGAFFSEEASVAVTIRAFAPSLEEAPFSPLHRTGSSGDDDAGGGGGGPSALAPFGSAGSAGFGLLMAGGGGGGGGGGSMMDASFSGAAAGMMDDGDGADGGLRGGGAAGGGAGAAGGAAGGGGMVVIPARMGADAVYRVADAESALEAALNPFTAALVAAGITPGGGVANGVGGGGLGAGGPSLGPGAASSLLVGGSLAGSLIGGGGDLSLAPSPEKRGSGVGASAAAEVKEGSDSVRDGKDKDGHHKDSRDREREGGEAGMPSARALLQRGMIAAIAEEDEEEEDEEEEEDDENGGGSDDGSRSGGGAGGGGRGRLGRSRADSRGSEDRSDGDGGGDSGGEEGSDGEGESLSRRSAADGGDDAASAGGAGSDMLRQGGSRVTSDSQVTSGSGGGRSGRKRSGKGDGRGAAAPAVSAAAAFAAAQTFVAGLLPELGLALDATAAAAFGGASAAAAAALNAGGSIGGALAVGEVDRDAPRLGPDGRQPAEAEPELYLSKEQLKGLQGAASSVQALHGDVTLLTRHAHFLRRVAAARDLADHVAALTAAPARPFPTRAAATKHVGRAIAAAHASGVAATLLQEARLAVAVVAAELELAAAVDVCSRIAVGKHSRDADIARLRAAVAVGKRLNAMVGAAVAARDLPGFVMPKPAEPDTSAAGAGAGMGRGSDAGGGSSGAPSLSHHPKPASLAAGGGAGGPSSDALDAAAGAGGGSSGSAAASSLGPVFRSTRLAPSLPTIEDGPGGLLERGEGLLARLACEVGVTDCVDAVSAAMRGLEDAVARHATEDPAYIPAPELTPEEAAAVQEAAAAHAALLAAPPPKPQPGKKAPPPPPPPPAHPAFPPTRFPLDWNGVPLPQTAQLTALQALQEAVHALGETVASARISGADEACITGAEAAFATAKAALDVGMDAERERVTNARIERAKTEKKKKGGAKKKK